MTPPEFYPATAIVPSEKRTDRILLRPLRATDVELDYDAVMSSAAQLRTWSQGNWPTDDFTLGENLADLQRHEREHNERVAFTFTVLDPGATRCLGCVYIMPLWPEIAGLCVGAAYAADVGLWVRTSEINTELDRHLLATLRDWLSSEWAFDCVVYAVSPGEARQGAILSEAGLERRGSFALADGRSCLVFS